MKVHLVAFRYYSPTLNIGWLA